MDKNVRTSQNGLSPKDVLFTAGLLQTRKKMINNVDNPPNPIFVSGELCSYAEFINSFRCISNCVSCFFGNSSLFCLAATTALTHQATYLNAFKHTEILIFPEKGFDIEAKAYTEAAHV